MAASTIDTSSSGTIVGPSAISGRELGQNPSWTEKRSSSSDRRRRSCERRRSITRAPHGKKWWLFESSLWDDDRDPDWWFAGTAIPLLAATIGPLANVLSIAALVTYWRMCLVDDITEKNAEKCVVNGNALLGEIYGQVYRDPDWCYKLNAISLAMGFIGNLFLLFNFTGRVRYMIALPVTLAAWYLAAGILIGITISMNVYVPPIRPQQTYTQGFWYAVIAAVLYMVCSMLLMGNMMGYFLGHYPQQFNLTDSQRTLILQTMLFFIWLAGGAGVFSRVESIYGQGDFEWSYVNALYFCDVTIITVGFGDLYPTSNLGRGLVFPYSVGGIIMLGLMISSITKFASELGENKVIQKHIERSRTRTIDRAVTSSADLETREQEQFRILNRPATSVPFDARDRAIKLRIVDDKDEAKQPSRLGTEGPIFQGLLRATTAPFQNLRNPARKPHLILLREGKDRFEAMRRIQSSTMAWKRWQQLTISVIAFGTLWCVGAVIFWQAEKESQGITYFESLYLCYVSLLTIGYGDLAPKSNAGRPFFVVWSLVAVPTMTILVADMGDTIIGNFKKATGRLADFTVLPEKGIWHRFLLNHPWLLSWLQNRNAKKAAKRRLNRGFETGPNVEESDEQAPTLDTLAVREERKLSDFELGRKLALAIRRTANDLRADPPRRYTYEEWVEYTQLIRFTSKKREDGEKEGAEEEEEELIHWDWIGEKSPMMAQITEAEFVLDRLCESMGRYIRRLAPNDLEVERPIDGTEPDGSGERVKKKESKDGELRDVG